MAVDPLRRAYDGLIDVVSALSAQDSFTPTGCHGWAVRDLVHHCWSDSQRGLVALHTPAGDEPADVDSVTYWSEWNDEPDGGWRYHRVVAALFGDWKQLVQQYAEAARATVHAAEHTAPDTLLHTQGHVITAADLISSLAVEATIHHLDLVAQLDRPGPAAECLGEVRRVLDELASAQAGCRLPRSWSDRDAALIGTGRRAAPADTPDGLLRAFPLLC